MEPRSIVTHINVEGTDFCVTDDYVREWGTNLCYDPKTRKGYQLSIGRMVALTSYEAFGADIYQAHECAARWILKARKAWDAVRGQQG